MSETELLELVDDSDEVISSVDKLILEAELKDDRLVEDLELFDDLLEEELDCELMLDGLLVLEADEGELALDAELLLLDEAEEAEDIELFELDEDELLD